MSEACISIIGIVLQVVAIIFSGLIAIWGARKAYKDNLRQILFTERLAFYSEVLSVFKFGLENDDVKTELGNLLMRANLMASPKIFCQLVEFEKGLNSKPTLDDLPKKFIVLVESMRWEKDNQKEISEEELKLIKEKVMNSPFRKQSMTSPEAVNEMASDL